MFPALCAYRHLPGKRGRPLHPPGWSVRRRGRGQTAHFVFRQSSQMYSIINKEMEEKREEQLRPRSQGGASKNIWLSRAAAKEPDAPVERRRMRHQAIKCN